MNVNLKSLVFLMQDIIIVDNKWKWTDKWIIQYNLISEENDRRRI